MRHSSSGDGGGSEREGAPGRQPVCELRHVTRTYGEGASAVHALDDVSLAVHSSEIVALVGPSGSGKTTLLQMAGAIDHPTAGQVFHCGQDLGDLDAGALTVLRRRHIGFVFQFFNLVPALSAEENVALVARLDGTPRAAARARARELLELAGLARRREHLPSELSGGEQQRVAIARALINQPRLILADEPTGNLDRATGEKVMEMLRDTARHQRTGLLLVTHDRLLLPQVDRTLTLTDGHLDVHPSHSEHASTPA